MKVIFLNYQTTDGTSEPIFETQIKQIPKIGDGVSFPFEEDIHYAEVKHIVHCFNLQSKFTHIEIELSDF